MDRSTLALALNSHPALRRAAVCRLATDFDLWRDAEPGDARLAAALGVPVAQLDRALGVLPGAASSAERQRRLAHEHGCRVITRFDDHYPAALRDLSLAPPVLYYRGDLPAGAAMAIVGSRRMDDYGRSAADLFAAGLAARGVTVVSGFALGVDQAAHRAAVEVGGKTVAVLGCGLDVDYPRGSRGLAAAIAANGALITEFPFGVEPRAWHFPVRNRVIAALSSGVLVVQAKKRSGSLITAHLALDLGREVFAVPGGIFDELSMGTNGLIADGAVAVSSPADVLDHLSLGWQRELFPEPEERPAAVTVRPPDGAAGRVFAALPRGTAATAEEVAASLETGVDQVLAALLELELGGFVDRLPGPVYEAARGMR